MNIEITPITYGIYVRKSSESEERQVQSLVRQTTELKQLIDRDGLIIYPEIFEETASAFKEGRPVFQKLVEKTEKGEINAWLCWHANRLSRNPIDAGKIVSLIDKGHLDHIRTVERTYHDNSQDKLMIHIEFGLSKNDSEEKSRIVKSGLRRRNDRGYPLGIPLTGYTHTGPRDGSGTARWIEDKKNMKLVRRVFERFLKGQDSLRTITQFSCDIGLRSEQRKKLGGRTISKTAIHRMLTSPVYAGFFHTTTGERKEMAADLPRIITEDEHRQCLEIFSAKCVRGPRRYYFFPFYGLVFSDKGERLGVDPKFQLRCDCLKKYSYATQTHCPHCKKSSEDLENPVYRTYRYYHSRRAKLGRAPFLRSIEERKIKALLATHIEEEIILPKSLASWSKRYLHELQDEALRSRKAEARMNDAHKQKLVSRRSKLRELYLDGHLEKKEFEEEMRIINTEAEMTRAPDFTLSADWKIEAQKILDLGSELLMLLRKGSDQEIHRAIEALGITMIWDGETLTFRHSKVLTKVLSLLKMAKDKKSEPEAAKEFLVELAHLPKAMKNEEEGPP